MVLIPMISVLSNALWLTPFSMIWPLQTALQFSVIKVQVFIKNDAAQVKSLRSCHGNLIIVTS